MTGQKERRMLAALEPTMAQHRLVFDKKAIKDETNQRQLTRLTDRRGSLTHDDRVDVLSAACSYWEERLHVDVDNVIQKRRDQAHMDTIEMWQSDKRVEGLFGDRLSGALRHHDNIFKNNQPKRVGKTGRMQWGRRV